MSTMTTLFALKDENSSYRNYEPFILFALYCIIYLSLFYFNNDVIFTNDFFARVLSGNFSPEKIASLVEQKRKLEWISYLAFPILLVIKITFPAFCIYSISFLQEINIKWKQVMRIVLISEFVFVLPAIIHSAYFTVHPPRNIHDATSFAPLSMAQLLGESLPAYLHYAAQTMNVFELCYCILLAKGMQFYTGKSVWFSFGLVMKSYVPMLILWIAFITFINIQFL